MRKNERLNFRVSEHEKSLIQSKADKSKTNLSGYLLACALDKKIVVVDGLREVLTELRRIGNNLNQIARVANATGQIDAVGYMANVSALNTALYQIKTAVMRG